MTPCMFNMVLYISFLHGFITDEQLVFVNTCLLIVEIFFSFNRYLVYVVKRNTKGYIITEKNIE